MNYGNYDNQYSTSYGAGGGADGGGFVAGEPTSSQAGGGKGYGKDTVRPMTIKQILDAQQPHPDAEFKSDGEPFSQVTFVGQIRSISTQPTNITYKIDDGTGLIEAKQWTDVDLANAKSTDDTMDLEEEPKPKLVEDGYCRVWGRLKAFNNKRHVGAHIIRPVVDYNEVNYHFLEATAVHLYFANGGPPNKDSATNGQSRDMQHPSAAGGGGADGGHLSGASPLARRVFSTLKALPQSNEGLHVQMIASHMNISTSEVFKGAEELVAAGVIFTTVDESTWAVMDT